MLHGVDDGSIVVSIDRDGNRAEVLDAHALLELEKGLGSGLPRAVYRVVAERKAVLNEMSAMETQLSQGMTYFIDDVNMRIPGSRR